MNFQRLLLGILLINYQCLYCDIVLKPHEDWWEKNVEEVMPTFAGWLGDSSSASRVQARMHIGRQHYTSVLDIPCGLATDFFGFQQDGMVIEYVGMDITPKLIRLAEDKKVPVMQGDIEEIPCKDSSFDVCYVRHILEHLTYYDKAITELIRVAAKEVLIVFFIKPGEEADKVTYITSMGSLLYHNCYNRKKMEEYITGNEKVRSYEWEEEDGNILTPVN